MPRDLIGGAVESAAPMTTLPCGPRAFGQARHQRAAVLLDALRLLAKHARDLAQDVDEGGLP